MSISFHCLLFCVPVMSEFRHWLNMIYQVLNFLIKSFWFNKTTQRTYEMISPHIATRLCESSIHHPLCWIYLWLSLFTRLRRWRDITRFRTTWTTDSFLFLNRALSEISRGVCGCSHSMKNTFRRVTTSHTFTDISSLRTDVYALCAHYIYPSSLWSERGTEKRRKKNGKTNGRETNYCDKKK